MPSPEDNFRLYVGKLKGETNYTLWHHRLQWGLKGLNKHYWDVLTEKRVPRFKFLREVPTIEEAKDLTAEDADVDANTITNTQARAYIEREFIQPIKDFEDWETLSNELFALFSSTLDNRIESNILRAESVQEAYKIITNLYGSISQQTLYQKWNNWTKCI